MGEYLADIVTAGAEDGKDCVADAPLQRRSGKASVGLHVPDLRLDGTSSPEELCQERGDAMRGSATARRYGLSRSLLSIWRREYRRGTLGCPDVGGGFVPLVMEGAASAPTDHAPQGSGDNRIDMTLTNGRCMTIPASLAPSHLAALLTVVDPQ